MQDLERDILEIAKRECKGEATNEEILWLQQPENLLGWCQSLLTALSDYESQAIYHRDRLAMLAEDAKVKLISLQEYKDEKDKFDMWYRKSQRYRNGISKRLNQVKILLAEDKTVDLIDEFSKLSKAIIDHENSASEGGRAPSPWDLVLWSSVKVLDI